jgi:calcium binding protein 39
VTTSEVAGVGAGHKKGGLFRTKARTPPEVVQYVAELLTYILNHREGGCSGGKRDSKLEHKVNNTCL